MNIKQRYLNLLSIALICLLGAVVYSNTWHSPFVFDDTSNIVNNSSIHNLSNIKDIWNAWPPRFIANLTLAINYHFGGIDVFGYHLFNIFVHLSAAIAVWWLTLLTLSTPALKNQKISGHSHLIALFAGLIFVSHPIQTEGVTYIIQRTTSLAALFYILSICLYAKSRLSGPRAISLPYYVLSLLSAILAMFTRESTATLPIAIVLYEVFFFKTPSPFPLPRWGEGIATQSPRGEGNRWFYLSPFIAMIFIIPVTMVLVNSISYLRKLNIGSVNISSLDYLLTQFRVVVTYIRLLILPINQNLDYDYAILKGFFEGPVLLSFSLLLALFAAAVLLYKRHRLMSFAIFWFFLTLSLESSIIPLEDVIFEHRLYLPMAGFGLFLTGIIYCAFGNKSTRPVTAILSVIIASYSVLTFNRNTIWKDDFTLWNDAVQKSPSKARTYNNRGFAYQSKGEPDQAISDYNKALEIKPDFCEAYYNRGFAYQSKGEPDQAISDYTKALEIRPDYYDAYYNRGTTYKDKGKLDEAISDYDKALKIKPNFYKAYNNRGLAYQLKGEFDQAISDYNKALEIKPDNYESYDNRGNVYKDKGNPDSAISDFNKALEIRPDYFKPYNNRGNAYQLKGEFNQAISDYNKALEIKPDLYETYYNRGIAYQAKGNIVQAISDYNKAIEINPNYSPVYSNRATAYFYIKEYNRAWEDVRKAETLGHKVNPTFIIKLMKDSGKNGS